MSSSRARRSSRAHLWFLLSVGIAGWTALVCAAPAVRAWPPVEAMALFLVVAAGARLLAFPLAGVDGDAEVSLDSAIFIASTACLGARVTAFGVASLLAGDSLGRAIFAPHRSACRRRDPLCHAAHAIYASGLTGGLLALLSRAFGVGKLPGDGANVLQVAALGSGFLVAHYLVQTVQLRIYGRPWQAALTRNAIGVAAEATLLPLAAAIVLIWSPERPIAFALLGSTYLLVNWGFNRLAQLAKATGRRVLELEALHRAGQALGSSLELPELMAKLLRETARVLPKATRLSAVVYRGGEAQKYALGSDGKIVLDAAADETRRWLKLKEPLVDDGAVTGVRSRLVVPLTMYGETLGALVAESELADAFGKNERRVLLAIAGQAAAAVENARLYALANVDGLTGLYCRRYFDVRLQQEIERARRFDSSFALILLDLDDFKRLNDTLGHQAGDRALREVAAIAASQLRGVDLAARYGGEELAFLLPRTSLSDAQAVAERIREAVAIHSISEGGRAMHITASLGVAGWAESGTDDVGTLIARADAALYRAKAAGKNRVAIDLSFEISPSLAPIRRRRA